MPRPIPIQLLLLFLPLAAGCAQIPAESAELSQQLGSQIDQLEQTHIALLGIFFADKQRQIDRFIEEEWAPEFSRNFFSNPQLVAKWEQASQSSNAADRLQFLLSVGPIVQQKITEKHLQLVSPLNETERQLRRQLQQNYLAARNINASLTQLLGSAAAVNKKQHHYQQQLGIDNTLLTTGLKKIDLAVEQLLDKAVSVSTQTDKVQDYLVRLKELSAPPTDNGGH